MFAIQNKASTWNSIPVECATVCNHRENCRIVFNSQSLCLPYQWRHLTARHTELLLDFLKVGYCALCAMAGTVPSFSGVTAVWGSGVVAGALQRSKLAIAASVITKDWTKWTNERCCIFMFCVAVDLFGASYTILLSILCLSVWHLKNAQIKSFV